MTQGFTGVRGSHQIWVNTAKRPVRSDVVVPVFPSSKPVQEMRPVTFLIVRSLVAASAVIVIAHAATCDRSRLQMLPGSEPTATSKLAPLSPDLSRYEPFPR